MGYKKKKQDDDMPDGCAGILIFGVIGGMFGFGLGLFAYSFLQAIGLSIVCCVVGGIAGLFIGEFLGSKTP